MKKKSGKKKRVNKKVKKIENGNKIYSILLLFLILLAGLLFETVKTKPVGASSEIRDPFEISELSLKFDNTQLYKYFSKQVKQDLSKKKSTRPNLEKNKLFVSKSVVNIDNAKHVKLQKKILVSQSTEKTKKIIKLKKNIDNQNSDLKNLDEEENLKLAVDTSGKAKETEGEKKLVVGSNDKSITYIQILQNPKDLNLNLKYARQQGKAGNFKQTISTLERLSMLYPDNLEIKLYLLSVLVQTDSPNKALTLIEEIKEKELSASDLQMVNEIEEELKSDQEPKLWNFYADFSTGVVQNNNVNSVSKTRLQYEQDSIVGFNTAKFDRTYSGGLGLTANRLLGQASSFSIIFSLAASNQEHDRTDDQEDYGITLSLDTSLGNQSLSPYLIYNKQDPKTDADNFSMMYGIGGYFQVGDRNSFSYGYNYTDSKADHNFSDTTANDTNAIAHGYTLGHDFAVNSILSTSTSVGFTHSDAKDNTNDTDAYDLGLRLNFAFPFAEISIGDSLSLTDYKKVDDSVNSGILRSDLTNTFDISLSKALGDFFPSIDPGKSLIVNLSFDRAISESNLSNYDYYANNFSFSLAKTVHLNK